MAEKMATVNPIEDFLSSEVDESVISALVGSLETELASPTNRDPPHQNSTSFVNSNHVDNTRAGDAVSTHSEVNTQAGQKAGLLQTNSQISANNTNGSNNSVSHAQLLGLNSIVTSTVEQANSSPGVSLVTTVNSHSSPLTIVSSASGSVNAGNVTPSNVSNASIKTDSGSQQGPNGVPKQVIVTIGSTNTGTVFGSSSQQNSISQNSTVVQTSNSSGGSAIYNLASVAAEQPPLSVPNNAQIKTQPVSQQGRLPGSLTVREQLEQQKDQKQAITIVNPGTTINKAQFVMKSEQIPTQVKPHVHSGKQEVKLMSQPQVIAASSPAVTQHTMNMVRTTAATTTSSGVITLTKPTPQQTVTVVRPPTSQIQILTNPRGASPLMQQKILAPRMNTPIRIAPQQPQTQVIRTPGSVGVSFMYCND